MLSFAYISLHSEYISARRLLAFAEFIKHLGMVERQRKVFVVQHSGPQPKSQNSLPGEYIAITMIGHV